MSEPTLTKHERPPEMPNPAINVTALAALYQGEKTDASYVFNMAMAMMGIALVYLVGAIPYVGKLSGAPNSGVFLLLLPVPLWLIAAFHSLMALNAMSHGISVRIIEDALVDASGLQLKGIKRDLVGSAAGDKIMDVTQAKPIHALTTVVIYLGVGLLVIGFTVHAVHSAKGLVHARALMIAGGAYSLTFTMVLLSWILGVRMINKGRREISKPVRSIGPARLQAASK